MNLFKFGLVILPMIAFPFLISASKNVWYIVFSLLACCFMSLYFYFRFSKEDKLKGEKK